MPWKTVVDPWYRKLALQIQKFQITALDNSFKRLLSESPCDNVWFHRDIKDPGAKEP